MSQNFIFFDVETSGINKYFGQIFQFAAILTDENFTVLDRFEIRSKRMSHIIPEPGALLVTGILPTQLENAKYTYYEFSSLIREKMLEWSPATFCGYNSLKFDEPFMRSMYYQNLYSPYLSQTNGNKRIDILPMVFAMEHLFPEALRN
jgi:exodeoxyribonuclease-1